MTGCGLLSMDTRRIEAGILNYGTDMDWQTTPYDMGLGQFVDLDGHDFVGRDALVRADKLGLVLLNDPEMMGQTGLMVLDREGDEQPVELTNLPFYDQEKLIPRGIAPSP